MRLPSMAGAPPKEARSAATRDSSLARALVAGACGAAVTLCVSAVVMLPVARDLGVSSFSHRAGTRLIAYATMLLGAVVGMALGRGTSSRRRAPLWLQPPPGTWGGHYPLACVAGLILGLVTLGTAVPVAAALDDFFKIFLALITPPAEQLSSWVSLVVTLAAGYLLCRETIRLLDRVIHRSRDVARQRAETREDTAGSSDVAGAPLTTLPASALVDIALRVSLGATIGIGFTLRLALLVADLRGANAAFALGDRSTQANILGIVAVIVHVGALGGALLGWKLDQYLRRRGPSRRVVPLGSWYGHTPLAWIGGIFAAKLLSGLAFALAQVVLVPMTLLPPPLDSMPLLLVLYFIAAVAWMLIIGRAAARGIDAIIVREASLRLPRTE